MKASVMAAVFAASITWLGAAVTEIDIQPGPAEMSDDEKVIVADPHGNLQHGVVLREETERNDNYGAMSQTTYHLRAKILSNEARSLGDIAIPVEHGAGDLIKWWGRTICPDGTHELPESALAVQMIAKFSSGKVQELRGALPGVGPGCVIDYGYEVRSEYFRNSERVFLQRAWPVRSLRYRWIPAREYSASYVVSRSEGLSIKAARDEHSVLVTASDLGPVDDEPHAPPPEESRASVVFYYTRGNETKQDYWNSEAKAAERALKSSFGGHAIADVVAALALPANASLEDRMRAAYTWIDQNLTNTTLTSAEEAELAKHEDDEKSAYSVSDVMKAKKGTPTQLDYVFAGLARALGAEANLVYAVDRTERYWNTSLRTTDQFRYTFVAVRAPGETDDKLIFVDAGSGMEFGEVPWRATGASALMCTAKGSTAVFIPPSAAKSNRTDIHVALNFSDDNETLHAKWDSTAGGAHGADRRRWLRYLGPRERKESLDRLCGSSSNTEVTSADLPGLENRSGPWKVVCELEQSELNLSDTTGSYSYGISGPWWPETPELTAATRTQGVLFDYPKADVVVMDITAPHGFQPKPPGAPTNLTSPYGRYILQMKATPTGFHVERLFALVTLVVKADEYPALRKFLEDVHNADRTSVKFERTRNQP